MPEFNKDFIQYNDKKVKEEKSSLAFYLSTRIAFYIVLIFFAIFFIWYTAFISTHSFFAVSGVSMMGTLNNQIPAQEMEAGKDFQNASYDAVYIDRLSKAEIFDIVVIETKEIDPKTGKNKHIIKRVMAQEGDYITIAKAENALGEERFYFHRIAAESLIDGKVGEDFVDLQARLEENDENGYAIYSALDWNKKAATQPVALSGGSQIYEQNFYNTFLESFILSENKQQFLDEGKFFVSDAGLLYVQVPNGKFFYMGDNRNHSTDARERGFENERAIVGRSEFVVFDFNFGNRLLEVVKFYFKEVEKFFAR